MKIIKATLNFQTNYGVLKTTNAPKFRIGNNSKTPDV